MRRVALAVLVFAMGVVGIGYAGALLTTPPAAWTGWALAQGTAVTLGALVLLAAARPTGVPAAAAVAAVATVATVGGGFGFALAAPDPGAVEPLLLGLPRRLAVVVYGVGLLPALVLPWAYAAAFDRAGLADGGSVEAPNRADATTSDAG